MRALFCKDTLLRPFRSMRGDPDRWISRLVFLLGPWAALWMVEILNENDVFQDLAAWQVLMNMIWYYLLFALCQLILGRRRRSAAVAVTLCFLVGLLNHYILRFRGRILFPADVAGWRTAANVASDFDYSLDHYIVQAAVLLVAYLFLVWACPAQRRRDRMPRLAGALLILFGAGYSFAFFCTGMLPRPGHLHPAVGHPGQRLPAELHGGHAVQLGGQARRITAGDRVLELAEEYPAVEADGSVTRPVNIIAIMNESFADLTIFEGLELEEDPTPFLHSMTENTIKGWMYSPVTGGGTASVEFEYLTGFSTLFQPPHTVAYQLYVEEGMPSLAALAGSQGYETTAFHPYLSSGWNRPIAYQCLSFDHQLYQEDVEDPYLIRRYISDRSDYETIFDVTGTTSPAFVFNVTMQNHSGYAQGWNNLERTILLPDELKQADSTAEQYMALARESDKALEELEAAHPELASPLSPTRRVGGEALSKFEKVEHAVPLESLQDVFSPDEVREFDGRVRESVPDAVYSVEPKVDGLSVALEYVDGASSAVQRAATAASART